MNRFRNPSFPFPIEKPADASSRQAPDGSSGMWMSPKIVFPHVMKTAGTTVTQWIEQHYDRKDVMTEASVWKDLLSMPEHNRQSKYFVRGHFGSYVTKYFGPKQGFETITVLRDPVTRVISHFWHYKRAPDISTRNVFQVVRSPEFTLDDFLEHPVTFPFAANFQTANFAFDIDQEYEPHRLSPRLAFRGNLNDAHYRQARKFLENCAVVGLTEDISGFTRHMNRRFAFHPNAQMMKTRAYQPPGFSVTPEQRKKIERLNQMDIELYDYAKSLDAQRRRIFSRRPVTNPLIASPAKTAVWLPHKAFWGSGWSDTQAYNDEVISAHRWSVGDQPATIEFGCKPNFRGTIRFRVLRFVSDHQLKSLTVFADDEQLNVTCIRRDDKHGPGGGIYSTDFVPKRNTVTVRVGVGKPMPFSAVNPLDSDDTPRGLALTRVILSQAF